MDERKAEPASGSPLAGVTRWFLLTGNRLVVSAVVLLGSARRFSRSGSSVSQP